MSFSRQAAKPNGGARRLQAMIAGYKPLPGVPDEFATEKGVPRRHWMRFLEGLNELSGPEIAAMKTAALQSAQGNPLTEVITQVVAEIRGYVAACARNVLGDGETIPSELVGAAISRIRFELATRLPAASLNRSPIERKYAPGVTDDALPGGRS